MSRFWVSLIKGNNSYNKWLQMVCIMDWIITILEGIVASESKHGVYAL